MDRNTILAAIRSNTPTDANADLPAVPKHSFSHDKPDEAAAAFAQTVLSVGGECITLSADETPTPETLAPYFDGHVPTILHAHFGVIENGACWIDHRPDNNRTRYTLPEYLAILLPHDALLPTMHEAYTRIAKLGIDDFGLFLSGPSKTADIEQALVLGAQGAIVTKVFLAPGEVT